MLHHSSTGYVGSIFCILCLLLILNTGINAQCLSKQSIWDSTDAISTNEDFSPIQKLKHFYALKNIADKCNLEPDSVYSKLLLKIGVMEIEANKNYNTGFNYLKLSLRINTPGKKGSSAYIAARSFYALGYYYKELGLSDKALNYFDSTIAAGSTIPNAAAYILGSRTYKADIYFQIGDFQKAIEENIEGINSSLQKNDSLHFFDFLVQRAQSFFYENEITRSLSDVSIIINAFERKKNINGFGSSEEMEKYRNQFASALKIKAFIFQKRQKYSSAELFFNKAIDARVLTKNYEQVANDFIDFGNFYLDSLNDYKNSKRCYLQTISYGEKLSDSLLLSKANANIGEIYLKQKDYKQSSLYNNKALAYLNINVHENILQNPTADQLNAVSMKELGLVIMSNKVQTLLEQFSKTKHETELSACLKTCLITDTLITKMRYAQLSNESKLYWRNYTRSFYDNAVKASYFAGNPELALFFMEKSRAVLLNDKLNELSASSYLSKADASLQESYEIKILELQQKLSTLADTSQQYQKLQYKLVNTKAEFEHFISTLDQKYPTYYQYKYEDSVPSLKDFQSYLARNHQSFVHYFVGDTTTYILGITPTSTKLIRLSQKEFNKDQLAQFLQLCSNKEELNNHYNVFASLSNSIYTTIFQPLNLPKGRTIICMDNIVIPFEALCTDAKGKNFLLNDYSFDYVYSARFLMKQFNNPVAKGNFAGFAPVSFNNDLKVAALTNAAVALKSSSSYYSNSKLFTHEDATRKNFFSYAASYSIVNIFSHAKADTTDNEPVLYMQDATIHLSELQRLHDPATKLVLLSACQTNVGKTATGEGIYSLARGFAAAGIPSVSATLWNADEETIYAISKSFNQYLSEGMNKDEALQKAKLDFIHSNDSDKMLPYYWANMILIGNADAVKLNASAKNYWPWTIGVCFIAVIIVLTWFYVKKKNKKSSSALA